MPLCVLLSRLLPDTCVRVCVNVRVRVCARASVCVCVAISATQEKSRGKKTPHSRESVALFW
jgi:hypothetical protein